VRVANRLRTCSHFDAPSRTPFPTFHISFGRAPKRDSFVFPFPFLPLYRRGSKGLLLLSVTAVLGPLPFVICDLLLSIFYLDFLPLNVRFFPSDLWAHGSHFSFFFFSPLSGHVPLSHPPVADPHTFSHLNSLHSLSSSSVVGVFSDSQFRELWLVACNLFSNVSSYCFRRVAAPKNQSSLLGHPSPWLAF